MQNGEVECFVTIAEPQTLQTKTGSVSVFSGEQQKQQRCHKIQENRLRRSMSGNSLPPTTTTGDVSVSQSYSLSPGRENSSGSMSQGLDSSTGPEQQPVTHVIASVVDPNSIENMSPWCREMLHEVMRSFQISFDKPMERQPIDSPSNVEFLNMADTSVRRLVKMAKHLTVFRSLDQTDQISLLKGAVVEVLILRSAKMFNSSSLSWQVNIYFPLISVQCDCHCPIGAVPSFANLRTCADRVVLHRRINFDI